MLYIISRVALEVAKSLVKAPEGRVETPEQEWQHHPGGKTPAKVAAWRFIAHAKAK